MSEHDHDPEAYKNEPGAIPLTARNIAPGHGEVLVGHAPYGLCAIEGENMEGKSRFLAAVTAIPLKTLKPGMLTITRGETDASVGLGASELRVESRTLGGREKIKVERKEIAAHGPIEELPDPIHLLISGGNHVSEDANWRTRLQALLAFHPVPVTDARLAALAGDADVHPHRRVSLELANAHEITPFPSLLEAADALADRSGILQRRAREAEGEAKALEAEVQRQKGQVEHITRAVADKLGEPRGVVVRAMDDPPDSSAIARLRHLENYRSRLEVRLDDRAQALQDRAKIRASQGPKPSVKAEEDAWNDVGRRIAATRVELAACEEEERQLVEAARESALAAQDANFKVQHHHQAWKEASARLQDALVADQGWPDVGVGELIPFCQEKLEGLLSVFPACVKARGRHLELQGQLDQIKDELSGTKALLAELLAEEVERSVALEVARQRVAAWQETADLLDAPLPEVSPAGFEDVPEVAKQLALLVKIQAPGEGYESAKAWVLESADQAIATVARQAKLTEAGGPYRAALAELKRLETERDAAQDRAERLRADVTAVWDRLGEVISGAVESELVRVGKGRSIDVRLEDGRWVDVADDVEISKGRLRRAFLEFYLERVELGERNVVIEDVIMLPIGPAGREAISRKAAAKKIRLLFEQPAEFRDLRVRWYGGAA